MEKLTIRWSSFFIFLALLNEIVWRTQSTEFWVSFKVFGILPITLIFAVLQLPLITKDSKIKKISLMNNIDYKKLKLGLSRGNKT